MEVFLLDTLDERQGPWIDGDSQVLERQGDVHSA